MDWHMEQLHIESRALCETFWFTWNNTWALCGMLTVNLPVGEC